MSLPDGTLVTPYPPPGQRHAGYSGVASYAANLANALCEEGANITVIAPTDPNSPHTYRDGNVEVIRAFDRGPRALTKAMRVAKATGAPVIHLQHEMFLYGGPASIPALVPALSRRKHGPRSVVTMHQVVDPVHVDAEYTAMHRVPVPAFAARTGLSTVQRTIAALADRVIVHEHAFTDVVPRSIAIPHGVEVTDPAKRQDRRAAREALGWDPDAFTALCFGFIAPYKGIELVCDAAIASEHTTLVVAGGEHPRLVDAGDDYSGQLRARYGHKVRFTGYVDDTDVATTFSAADVALFSYPQPHASSGAFALALAHGTPALMSPALATVSGAPDVLRMPDTAAELGARLDQMANNPDERRILTDATAHLAQARTWPAIARRHLETYEETRDASSALGRRLRSTQSR